jgi:hypothetical protein
MMFWAWGDEQRKWTSMGVGEGINGKQDRRLQRYIAARLGPIPGWSMGYGFDLAEYTNRNQLQSWQRYLREHFGWQHLLSARATDLDSSDHMNGYAITDREIGDFYGPAYPDVEKIIEHLESDTDNPHLYEERHTWKRWGLDETQTRRLVWRTVMANGMGGWYGFFSDAPYPSSLKKAFRTHYTFWHEHGRFMLGLQRANQLTDGYALVSDNKANYLVYIEGASSIDIDLSGMNEAQSAIAVNTTEAYREIDLGRLSPEQQVIDLPEDSDWAVAIGEQG